MRTPSQVRAATLSLALLLQAWSPAPVLAEDKATPTPQPAAAGTTTAAPAGNADNSGNANAAATSAATSSEAAASAAAASSAPAEPKLIYRPGQALSIDTDTEDITPTYDVALAQKQVAAYPDSPEAAFILAVALTRTSRVEEALKEVQRARKLAETKGGPAYFDKMISTYEKMLVSYPNDNRVRYGLAWAYYMKAYLLSRQSRRVAAWKAANPQLVPLLEAQQKANQTANNQPASNGGATAAAANHGNPTAAATSAGISNKQVVKALHGDAAAATAAIGALAANAATMPKGKAPDLDKIPHIPGALEKVDPADIPQIRTYFDQALRKIDEILKREPTDVWSIVYGAHLRAEYTGDLGGAMKTWHAVASKYPNNPAPYFFLGEGYLKQGNLKESINNVSRAIALRALGN